MNEMIHRKGRNPRNRARNLYEYDKENLIRNDLESGYSVSSCSAWFAKSLGFGFWVLGFGVWISTLHPGVSALLFRLVLSRLDIDDTARLARRNGTDGRLNESLIVRAKVIPP
ncbi:hypothetical protein HRR83_002930 [Exophiala dermatitidis]|uniref:Uncharacterized protein n=1 Tax=Exophiala dermatitidis TaxID=5970 RepID=A0AAN6EMB1_EXODE|nr:hypothetical protein HRR73_008064 [Exophiala dermatitidis]KAJ4520642.1 hypothetical protein HRR74_003640 [Exophiala dermatitidis]KAJ4537716.1 hypothetical protein HRR76_005707 [Exophiala dermatitidis]KAJ4551619.1 hypothetical protein HRR77_002852 [Exophiala dermatitidis]KAJ4569354.1 hypothetical protein HRR79_004206 [Exophiala dermatitidis]